jgi:succinyl-CoA synthetase beta subunit
MNIHEYQGKELPKKYGVAVLDGHVAWTPEEAESAARKLPGPVFVVKSQIHAGGRGAGRFEGDPGGKGGVRLAKSPEETRAAAEAMQGRREPRPGLVLAGGRRPDADVRGRRGE